MFLDSKHDTPIKVRVAKRSWPPSTSLKSSKRQPTSPSSASACRPTVPRSGTDPLPRHSRTSPRADPIRRSRLRRRLSYARRQRQIDSARSQKCEASGRLHNLWCQPAHNPAHGSAWQADHPARHSRSLRHRCPHTVFRTLSHGQLHNGPADPPSQANRAQARRPSRLILTRTPPTSRHPATRAHNRTPAPTMTSPSGCI